jgi:hypothetical protein
MENNNEMDEQDHKPLTDKELVRVAALTFVFLVYFFIFLKILVLQ